MNRFLDKDRAIVTDVPGTTRDSIEETLNIQGLPVVLVDTAGWRETNDPVEKIGIERTRKLARDADLILFMVDAGIGLTTEDHDIYRVVNGNNLILLINKIDLLPKEVPFELPLEWSEFDTVRASVKYGDGLDALKDRIYRFGTRNDGSGVDRIVPTLRQKQLIEKTRSGAASARVAIKAGRFLELVAIDLQDAVNALDQVVGVQVTGDVLDEIFSKFCIGK